MYANITEHEVKNVRVAPNKRTNKCAGALVANSMYVAYLRAFEYFCNLCALNQLRNLVKMKRTTSYIHTYHLEHSWSEHIFKKFVIGSRTLPKSLFGNKRKSSTYCVYTNRYIYFVYVCICTCALFLCKFTSGFIFFRLGVDMQRFRRGLSCPVATRASLKRRSNKLVGEAEIFVDCGKLFSYTFSILKCFST